MFCVILFHYPKMFSFFARLVLRTKINIFSYDGIFSPRELATGRDDWLPNTQIEPGQVNSQSVWLQSNTSSNHKLLCKSGLILHELKDFLALPVTTVTRKKIIEDL